MLPLRSSVALLALVAALTFSCSDAPEGAPARRLPGGEGRAPAAPSLSARSAGGAGGEPQAQVLRPQAPARRSDFDEIAAGVDPAWSADPWAGEFLAASAEQLLLQVARHLAGGGAPDALRNVVTRGLKGAVPTESGGTQALEGEDLLRWVQSRLVVEGPASSLVVEVSVMEVEAPGMGLAGEGEGRTRVHIRTGSDPQGAGLQVGSQRDLTLNVRWRLGQRARISALEVVRASAHSGPPPFRDVTREVLGESGGGAGLLLLGALEAAGRTDALAPVGDLLTAMHGVAVGDLDGDGWDDLVVARAAGQPNEVWMNTGGAFTEEGGRRELDWLEGCGGVLIADLDGDGARDVVVGMGPDVVVAWNDGAGAFATRTVLPREGDARVYSIAAADVDLDGDLDLYDTRYFRADEGGAQAPTPYHDAVNGAPNVFWRNLAVHPDGGAKRRFKADNVGVGLDAQNDRFSMVSVFDDFDGDGDLDLYVANDFGRNNLYLAAGGGFEAAPDGPLTDKAAGMGLSLGDADLDGTTDLIVSNMYSAAGGRVTRDPRFLRDAQPALREEFVRHARGNTIFRGLGGGRFEDLTEMAGVAPGGWAWGSRFVDWNRDGLPDLVVPNGFLSGRKGPDLQSFFWRRVVGATPLPGGASPARLDAYLGAWSVISHLSQFGRQDWNARERTFAYLNRGGLRFEDVSISSGLGIPDDGRSLAVADLDHDGRLDLVFRNRTAPTLRLFQGIEPLGRSVAFRLAQAGLNRDGIGALVTLTYAGTPRRSRILAGDGFLGSSPPEAFYGLGDGTSGDLPDPSVSVRWPDGQEEAFRLPEGSTLSGGSWLLERGTGIAQLRFSQGAPAPPLEASVKAPPPGGAPGAPRVRVPLHAEFPLGGWRLPSFGGAPTRADERCAANGLLVVLWSSDVPASLGALARVPELTLPVHVLALDKVRASDAVREASAALGLLEHAGRADTATRLILDLVLGRTLAPFESMPLPLGLLLDEAGDLACLYVGALPPDVIEEDAARLAAREDLRATTCLTGGQWLRGDPVRGLRTLYDGLRARGFNEFVEHIEAYAGR